jgi:serine/threonine protein kinase
MNELIKRRKKLTEPETRFFMRQLLDAVKYLHEQLVIHRDLKLGNLFLDKNLNIKVGDLGLATRLESVDEKRKTICGTPNYIAPEVIQGDRATRGHSFEVDVWSMGVIMYTCLVGKPPYEAKDVKATYQRILANEYKFPNDIAMSSDAKDLIYCMLQSKPLDRPTLKEIALHPFFTANYIPDSLPSNATHVAPQWDKPLETSSSSGYGQKKSLNRPALPKSTSQRRPFSMRDVNVDATGASNVNDKQQITKPKEVTVPSPMMDVQGAVKNAWSAVMDAANSNGTGTPAHHPGGFQVFDETADSNGKTKEIISRTANMVIHGHDASPFSAAPTSNPSPRGGSVTPSLSQPNCESDAYTLTNMVDRISTVLDVVSMRSYSSVAFDSPSLTPFTRGGPTTWVARYVDYTSKYGLGYLLNDGRYVLNIVRFYLLTF